MSVGLVIVSHSERLATGVVELVAQMAPEVRVLAAGGLAHGGLGTDFETVTRALGDADSGDGVVLLYDMGSAQMTAELAVESLGDPSRAIVADAPLVEGAVAAAVAAQGGVDRTAVARAATEVPLVADAEIEAPGSDEELRQDFLLDNEVGLHARPAALLARGLAGLRASVTVEYDGKQSDAASVLGVMGLGARRGDRISVSARGPDAARALEQVADLVRGNFSEGA